MAKYRKKPVVVEAIRCKEAIEAFSNMPSWLQNAYEVGSIVITEKGIYIDTLEGTMLANPDDYIIQGIAGEIYPCQSGIFEATYELVAEEN